MLNRVVSGIDAGDDNVVPDDISAGSEGRADSILAGGIVEFKFVGEGLSIEGVIDIAGDS